MSKFWLTLLIAALSTALAQTLIKFAAQQKLTAAGFSLKTAVAIVSNPYIWLSGCLYVFSFLLSIKIFEAGRLSLVTPIFMGSVFLFVTLLACAIFKEDLSPRILLGQGVILTGIALVASQT